MSEAEVYRDSIERMDDTEIAERLRNGDFDDVAKPIAESILLARGITPIEQEQLVEEVKTGQATKKKRISITGLLIGAFLAPIGGTLGSYLAAALGAGLGAGILFWLGYKLGAFISNKVGSIQSKPMRIAAKVVIVIAMFFVTALLTAILKVLKH